MTRLRRIVLWPLIFLVCIALPIVPLLIILFPQFLLAPYPAVAGAVIASAVGAGMVLVGLILNIYREDQLLKRKYREKRLEEVYAPIMTFIMEWKDWYGRPKTRKKDNLYKALRASLGSFVPNMKKIDKILRGKPNLIPEDVFQTWIKFFPHHNDPQYDEETIARLKYFCDYIEEKYYDLLKKLKLPR